jgi:hypothetical protein
MLYWMDTSSRGRITPKLVPAVGLAATALLLAIVVILATRPGEEHPGPAPAAKSHSSRESKPLRPAEIEAISPQAQDTNQPEPVLNGSWEERLDAILSGEGGNREAVRLLLQDFDRLPPDAQAEYIAHALNLCEDENYTSVSAIYLRDVTPSEVREQIFDDALNRPDEIKLLMLARTMTTPNHPMQDEAKEILCLYLELDPGVDAAANINWDERVRAYLKSSAAEE